MPDVFPEIKIGDRIRFTAALREGNRTAVRVVTGFYNGSPEVRFNGYRDFIVRRAEISEVLPA